jgi:hypothetical protein
LYTIISLFLILFSSGSLTQAYLFSTSQSKHWY